MISKIEHAGSVHFNITRDAAIAAGIPEAVITAAERAEKLAVVRAERTRLLAASDWTQMGDAPLSKEEKAAWAGYRQALRDLPETVVSLDSVDWPTHP